MMTFHDFVELVATKKRFNVGQDGQEVLLGLLEEANRRPHRLQCGTLLYRAQRGATYSQEITGHGYPVEVAHAFDAVRMKPTAAFAKASRVSPEGICVLYTAADPCTAAAETRPHAGSDITIAQMRVVRDLQLADCFSNRPTSVFDAPFAREANPKLANWMDLQSHLGHPVNSEDNAIMYSAAQMIAEAFKSAGFDGIRYKSSLGEGANIALFDLDAAEVTESRVVSVRGISYDIDAEPHILRRSWRPIDDSPTEH